MQTIPGKGWQVAAVVSIKLAEITLLPISSNLESKRSLKSERRRTFADVVLGRIFLQCPWILHHTPTPRASLLRYLGGRQVPQGLRRWHECKIGSCQAPSPPLSRGRRSRPASNLKPYTRMEGEYTSGEVFSRTRGSYTR